MITKETLSRCQEGLADKERTIEEIYKDQNKYRSKIYELRDQCRALKEQLAEANKKIAMLMAENPL